jgi:hypothetical protein
VKINTLIAISSDNVQIVNKTTLQMQFINELHLIGQLFLNKTYSWLKEFSRAELTLLVLSDDIKCFPL